MVEPQANEAYVDAKVAASVAVEATRAQTAEKSLSDRIDTKQAALDASQVTALNSGINAQRVYDIVSLAGGDSNTGKSVRTIAGEEMMKLVDGAPDTYDTLKEIADWIAKDETGTQAIINQVKGLTEKVAQKAEIPKYEFVTAAITDGVLTVAPYTNAQVTSDGTAFEVAVGKGDGKTRDCVLRVECGETVPKITWGAKFHPRTDAETDFKCEAGKRNVYWITEHSPNEFVVAGWQETTGGNAS